jgi:hypothetical protein
MALFMLTFCENPITKIEEDLGFTEYLARPGISQSMLKLFDYDSGGCPALYKYAVGNPGSAIPATKALEDGRRYHHFLLEPESFDQYYAELTEEIEQRLFADALACKSKAAGFSQRLGTFIAWKADREAEGKAVVTRDEAQMLRDMRDAIFANPDVSEWFDFKEAKLEVSFFSGWKAGDAQFQMKGRSDTVPPGDSIIDLKTARTAHPEEFARVAWRLGYHIQASFYIDLARKNGLDKKRFGFLAQDKFPPYLACIHWLGDDWIRYGRVRYTKILLDIADAIRRNDWPGYRSGELMPPSWAQTEIESVAA